MEYGMGENTVILESCHNLRAMGRDALKGKWMIAAVAMIIYYAVLEIIPIILDSFFGVQVGTLHYSYSYSYDIVNTYYEGINMSPMSPLYILLIAGPIAFGITYFFLKLYRKEETKNSDLFVGFERFGRYLGLMLFMTLFIFLWTLIPIVGIIFGIIASIKYSQAFMIAIDHPDMSISECVNYSKFLMNGNKAKYFVMNLSFIGWIILAGLVEGIIVGIVSQITSVLIVVGVAQFVGLIGAFFVVAYMMSTQMAFYEILIGRENAESYQPGQY